MSSCKKWLNIKTNINEDCCNINLHNKSNNKASEYAFGYNTRCNNNNNYLCEVGLNQQYPSLVCGNVHNDSHFRYGEKGNVMTHTKARQELKTRPYRTVPYMGECRAPLMETDTYSKILHGENTRTSKSCMPQVTNERWIPLVPCIKKNIQNPKHYIPTHWVRGGMSTSAYYRNVDYLNECGIKKSKPSSFIPDVRVSDRIKQQKMQGLNLPVFS